MTLSQLEIFSLVAELGGFTSTASHLRITQSGVSHALKSLERELGVELFRRERAQVELTDVGQRLLQRARGILGLAECMRQESADARRTRQGTLRIGSFGPTSSIRLLPRILGEYRRSYPGIEVHVDEGPDGQVVQWLLDRRIDIGFVVLPEERFRTYPLIEDQMVAVVPADHPLASRDAISLLELCESPFILTEAGSAELVSRLFMSARLHPVIRYRSSQLLSTLEAVARGEGVTILAESALPRQESAPRAYVEKPLRPVVKRDVGLALLDDRQASSATQAFVKLALRLRSTGMLTAS